MAAVQRPLIGITAYSEPSVRWGAWDSPAILLPTAYVASVERAGGRPLLVPPSDEAVDETLAALDGLVLSGGSDLDPELYGQERHRETNGIVPERDRGELELLRAALDRELPVLAICRGSQVLNVALGGDLVQHLPETVGHENHKLVPGVFGGHPVRVEAGSRVGSLVRGHDVKSHHHQGFGRLGDGLRVVAWADDGTPEAVEAEDGRFAVGVLWHPEEGEDAGLFEGLVAEARAYRAARR